ncbi:MAG: hypothetical protein EXR50_06055 [Dehalococcoidia bacterium]|nr:hypothetical protein [Dehalococcoidia bacterium]
MIRSKASTLPLLALAIISWSLLAWLILNTSPAEPENRSWFIVLLFASVVLTVSVMTYWLSYKIFAYKRYQGDWMRSLVTGTFASACASFLAWLQLARGITIPMLILVCFLFISLELLIWPFKKQ